MTTAVAERAQATLPEAAPREYRWAADDFERACEAGVFGHDRRLELIHGKVIDRMGQGPLHSSLAAYIADCLRAALSPRYTVREERAIRISSDGEPVPDVSVVTGKNLDYLGQHPAPHEAVLLVEVAVSSADYDLGEKALLYAQAGAADYWVVLPERDQIMVHRQPGSTGYGSVSQHGEADTLSPLAASDVTLAVRDLLGRGEKPEEA